MVCVPCSISRRKNTMKFMRKLVASVAAVTVAATSVATFAFSASALEYDGDMIVSTDKGPYTAYLCIQAGADKRSVTDDYPNAVEKEKNSKGISCADATSQVTARIP